MPLFAALTLVVRHGRTETRMVPIAGTSLWRLAVDDAATAAQRVLARLAKPAETAALPAAALVLLILAIPAVPVRVVAAITAGAALAAWWARARRALLGTVPSEPTDDRGETDRRTRATRHAHDRDREVAGRDAELASTERATHRFPSDDRSATDAIRVI